MYLVISTSFLELALECHFNQIQNCKIKEWMLFNLAFLDSLVGKNQNKYVIFCENWILGPFLAIWFSDFSPKSDFLRFSDRAVLVGCSTTYENFVITSNCMEFLFMVIMSP